MVPLPEGWRVMYCEETHFPYFVSPSNVSQRVAPCNPVARQTAAWAPGPSLGPPRLPSPVRLVSAVDKRAREPVQDESPRDVRFSVGTSRPKQAAGWA